jgi:hypothetical protein
MNSIIAYTYLLGLFMPLVFFYFNEGHLSENRYLSIFFTSLYLLESFAFFYMRSILRGNNRLSKTDYLHFVLFVISFIGYIPYFYSDWDFKIMVAQNLQSEH